MTEAKEWEIWVQIGDKRAFPLSVLNTTTVGAFFSVIKAKFENELAVCGLTEMVVRAPDATLPDGTDPESVKPAEFKQVLNDPKAKLAEVLKSTIANEKGEYVVYVELPKRTWLASLDSSLLMDERISVYVPSYSKGRVGRHYPTTLGKWSSFTAEALKFDFSAFKAPSKWAELIETPKIIHEADVTQALKLNVCRFFEGSTLGAIYKPRTFCATKRQCLLVGEPDLACLDLNENVCDVIEVKSPWSVQIYDGNLVDLFNSRKIDTDTARAIAQVFGYMLDNSCKYGVLSTYNGTLFMSAKDRDHVDISEVVMADAKAVTLRRAFAYWLFLCTHSGLLA